MMNLMDLVFFIGLCCIDLWNFVVEEGGGLVEGRWRFVGYDECGGMGLMERSLDV